MCDPEFMDFQRAAILALAQTKFNAEDPNHELTIQAIRFYCAAHLPNHSLSVLKTQIDLSKYIFPTSLDSIEYADNMFEKDVSEAIGFSNGNKLYEDTVETGMLGLLCTINFLERLDRLYESTKDLIQNFEGEEEGIICLYNMMYLCQSSPGAECKDGFPLVLVLFEIVKNLLNLVEEKPFIAKNNF